MKNITIYKRGRMLKECTYYTFAANVKIDRLSIPSQVFLGSKNIYIKFANSGIGVRICPFLKKRRIQKIVKIQQVLSQYNLSPLPYSQELCEFKCLFSSKVKLLKTKKIFKCYCIFQENIQKIREYNHQKEKHTEPFVSFRKKVREVSVFNGFKDRDLKKGNILISASGPRCIDFDDWTIVNKSLFKKILFKNKDHDYFCHFYM